MAPVTVEAPPIKLNLGCGTDYKGHGVLNIDARRLIPPDGIYFLRGDIGDLLHYVQPNSADEIWALDVLEHFPQAEARRLLNEWISVLLPGGVLHLSTPDLEVLARFILGERTWTDENKAYQVYGGQDYAENFHRAGFTRTFLRGLLEERGMTVESITVHPACETTMVFKARKNG